MGTARRSTLVERHWKWLVLLVWLGVLRLVHLPANGPTSASSPSATPTTICGSCRSAACFTARAGSTFGNYRMNPPFGANIHWSRLVDLPIAGLILALAAVPRRAGGGALGGRDRAAAALSAAALLAGADGAAADRPARLSARASSPCSSPARPTACSCPSGSIITAGSSRCSRSASPAIADPEARARRADARHRDARCRSPSGWR